MRQRRIEPQRLVRPPAVVELAEGIDLGLQLEHVADLDPIQVLVLEGAEGLDLRMMKGRVVGLRPALAAAGVVLLCIFLSGCLRESLPPLPITIINDTDASVTIWIEHEGAEFRPEDDDPRLDPGESAVYGLHTKYASIEFNNACTDGDVIARRDDGSEIRVPPPICDDSFVELSEYGEES